MEPSIYENGVVVNWLRDHRSLLVAIGIEAAQAQHTKDEANALKRWAYGRSTLLEIGVADGASAAVLLSAMRAGGDLWLVDPFHLSRNPFFNTGRWAARRTVAAQHKNPQVDVYFVEEYSEIAAKKWRSPLEFVFIDGDHSYDSVLADWNAWSPFVVPSGVVAFHDAIRAAGHPDGPARVVDDLFRKEAIPGWTIVEEVDTLAVVRRSE